MTSFGMVPAYRLAVRRRRGCAAVVLRGVRMSVWGRPRMGIRPATRLGQGGCGSESESSGFLLLVLGVVFFSVEKP